MVTKLGLSCLKKIIGNENGVMNGKHMDVSERTSQEVEQNGSMTGFIIRTLHQSLR